MVPVVAVSPQTPLVGADAAFYAVFGVFVAAFAVLSVVTIRWALQRDRAGRAQWVQRRREQAAGPVTAPPPGPNGHRPPRRPDRRRKAPG